MEAWQGGVRRGTRPWNSDVLRIDLNFYLRVRPKAVTLMVLLDIDLVEDRQV